MKEGIIYLFMIMILFGIALIAFIGVFFFVDQTPTIPNPDKTLCLKQNEVTGEYFHNVGCCKICNSLGYEFMYNKFSQAMFKTDIDECYCKNNNNIVRIY